jgi:hypothetical protein
MIASCGLDCSKCEGFLATQANSDTMRAEVAQKWSALYQTELKPEQINCDGCRTEGKKLFYCEHICQIRQCCISKNLANCAACDEYLCEKLSAFVKMAPEAGANLERLRH